MNLPSPHSAESAGRSCSDFLQMAERELSAFIRSVTELFGPTQAELSAEDWLRELNNSEALPTTIREWHSFSAKVSGKLARRISLAVIANQLSIA